MYDDCDIELEQGGKTAYFHMLRDTGYSKSEASAEVTRREAEIAASKVCKGARSIRVTLPAELIDGKELKYTLPKILWMCGFNTKTAPFEKHFGFYSTGKEGCGGRKLGRYYVGEERLDKKWVTLKTTSGLPVASYEAIDLAGGRGFRLGDIRSNIGRKPTP